MRFPSTVLLREHPRALKESPRSIILRSSANRVHARLLRLQVQYWQGKGRWCIAHKESRSPHKVHSLQIGWRLEHRLATNEHESLRLAETPSRLVVSPQQLALPVRSVD